MDAAVVAVRVLLHLNLHLVEALAIDAVDGPLRHEGMLVYALHDTEYGDRLNLAAIDHKDLHVAARVPSLAVEHGDATVRLRQNSVGYLAPLGREDEELRGLAVGVDDLVGDERDDECHHDTIYNSRNARLETLLDSAREGEENRAAYDKHIRVYHDTAYAGVADLRHAGGHYIGATRRAVVYEAGADTRAAENGAKHQRYGAVRNQRVSEAHEEALADTDGKSHYGDAEDGAEHERASHYLIGYSQKYEVEGIRRHGNRDQAVGAEIYQGRHTGHTSDHDLMRQDTGREAKSVERKPKDDEQVVARVDQQAVVLVGCW